ncbi:hypothetical protein HZZ13_28120 [Bradyrhizobium sp. CNPSo 4010]|uniref:Uncharacterized protein n=1 Tax=Bradyrhizobium agreste TaxID=2751811 RepID=A0ABS0PWN9_9BRAD|nr:hypothetical protein [Bradyrhizobium agreste]MBH5401626.1 hypothetical protein [Bradyrhizobium agreste]
MTAMYELNDRELDDVAAGQLSSNPIIAQGGLINVGVNAVVQAADVLSHNSFLNNNHTDVAIAVLGTAIA